MKRKRNFNNKSNFDFKFMKCLFLIFLIVVLTISHLKKFSDRVTPKIIAISKQKANDMVYNVITNNVNKYVLDNSELLKDIIQVSVNNEGEILTAEFNLDSAYLLIRNITKNINDNIKLNEGDEGVYFEVPVGYYFNSSFFNDMGPKIPVNIKFTGNILSNLNTKITNYGMNNALVELYANIVIVEEVINPVSNSIIRTNYDVLLSSKLINGRIPSFYGGSIERQTKIFNVSNE